MASTTTNPRSVKPDDAGGDRQATGSTNGARDRLAATTGMVSDAAGAVATAASDAATRMPEAVERSRTAFAEANRTIRTGSDEALSAGTALSFGFAAGLLVGGANRLLIAVAMIPVAMLGMALFERTIDARTGGKSRSEAGL
jgi:hypothetical protein